MNRTINLTMNKPLINHNLKNITKQFKRSNPSNSKVPTKSPIKSIIRNYSNDHHKDKTSNNNSFRRVYFYDLDFKGRLYLSETLNKNFTNFYRDETFLNVFFKKLRKNEEDLKKKDEEEEEEEGLRLLKKISRDEGFEFISYCNGELNFLRSEFTPIVYKTFLSSSGELVYGGSLRQRFLPDSLKIDLETGSIFHLSPSENRYGRYSMISNDLIRIKTKNDPEDEDKRGLVEVGNDDDGESERLIVTLESNDDGSDEEGDQKFYLIWKGSKYPIQTLSRENS